MSIANSKKLTIISAIGIIILSSLLYLFYETGLILNDRSKNNKNIEQINLNYMNKSIDGYNGEIDYQEFGGRFISWSLLTLYNEGDYINNIEYDFIFEENHIYVQSIIDQEIYEVYDFIEHEN